MAQLIVDTSGYLAGTAAAHPLHDTVLKILGGVASRRSSRRS